MLALLWLHQPAHQHAAYTRTVCCILPQAPGARVATCAHLWSCMTGMNHRATKPKL